MIGSALWSGRIDRPAAGAAGRYRPARGLLGTRERSARGLVGHGLSSWNAEWTDPGKQFGNPEDLHPVLRYGFSVVA